MSTQVPIAQTRSPVAISLGNYLTTAPALKSRTGLLNNKDDVQFFRYKRFVRAVLSPEYQANQARYKLPSIQTPEEAQKAFVMMIQNQMIIPVDKLHYADIKATRGWKPNREKPTLRRTDKAVLEPDVYYAWIYQPPNPYMMLYSILAIVGVFTIVLFPLWPAFMKKGVWYLSMGMLGLIALFFVIALVRLVIYIVSLVAMPRPFWLFPNLFADCGVIESFQPLYAWEEPKKKKGKKRAKGTESVAGTEGAGSEGPTDAGSTSGAAEGSTSASGVETSGSLPARRKVILEDVEE